MCIFIHIYIRGCVHVICRASSPNNAPNRSNRHVRVPVRYDFSSNRDNGRSLGGGHGNRDRDRDRDNAYRRM